jgi:hypothetical protein
MLLRSLWLLALFAVTSLAQEMATPNDTAKFLAGVPVRDTPLEALSRNPAWVDHATEFDKAWQQLDARQLAKIRAWGPEFLGEAYTARGPMFYFFSGPDILYSNAFYPNASTYVLAGLEPVGTPPDVLHLPSGALAAGLANLRKSLNSVLSFSFFITKDMKVDLRQNQLSGTLPVLYVFLARAGCRIESVDLVWLDKAGAITTSKTATSGARIVFFGPGGAQQMLYYFSTDLSNEGIRSQPGFVKFCDQLGQGRSLVKAASYLMHLGSFTTARDFLLTHSTTLVQDDSGIPIANFEPAKWAVRYLGSYPGPIELFKQHTQPDLAAIYHKSNPPPLPFGFGYRWHPSESSLMIATPRGAAIQPASSSAQQTP